MTVVEYCIIKNQCYIALSAYSVTLLKYVVEATHKKIREGDVRMLEQLSLDRFPIHWFFDNVIVIGRLGRRNRVHEQL